MISVGAKFGGPELHKSRIGDWIDRVSNVVNEERGSFEVPREPSVYVVFCVPGSEVKFDFDAMQEREFSEEAMQLTVEVVVPDEVLLQSDPSKFLFDWLHGGNAVAFEFYYQKGIDFALAEAEDLVKRVGQRLGC